MNWARRPLAIPDGEKKIKSKTYQVSEACRREEKTKEEKSLRGATEFALELLQLQEMMKGRKKFRGAKPPFIGRNQLPRKPTSSEYIHLSSEKIFKTMDIVNITSIF